MARIFRALALSALALFGAPVYAAESGCEQQYYLGVSPSLASEKLAAQTRAVCFSEIAILYSGLARTPLWSAERLTPARIERARGLGRLRSNAFHEEPRLPADERSWLSDYRRSGFDRGHMAPNGDMSTPESQAESFSLANMVPQDPCNNEVLWEGIESAVRDIALRDEVFVVTGPAFLGAELQSLNSRVLVPTHLYKAIYVPARNEAAAYFAPNDPSQDWEALSIAELTARVGVDVFPQLDGDVRRHAMVLPPPTPHFGCRLQTSEARR
ncbi:MAG: DNA/RNA non-specific endonuclease [Rhodomicrobium sp.]|jgi:endonuclease G